jgi:hypothetical protein
MSRPMDTLRMTQLSWVGGAALLISIAAISLSLIQASREWTPQITGPVFANWDERVANTVEIEIGSAQDRFALRQSGDGWVMPSRDDYPVRAARLAELDAFLGSLEFEGPRTADPDRHARLGLSEPGSESAASRVTLRNAAGDVLADVLLGEERDGRIYLRFPGEDQTWAARTPGGATTLPDIDLADAWLELDFVALGRTAIARTQITPESGPAYLLERPGQSARNFSLRRPSGWRPITAGAGNGPGAGLARLRFRDVRRADRLRGDTVASHVAETFSGLRLSMDIIAQGDTRWAVITTRALTDGSEQAALDMNQRVAGWAYLLSDASIDRLLRPLDQIADPQNTD